MSGAPIISGTNQLPKPPINAGMTTKKTMINPCAEMITFHIWPGSADSRLKYCTPGSCSSMRMSTEKAPPIRPAITEKTR